MYRVKDVLEETLLVVSSKEDEEGSVFSVGADEMASLEDDKELSVTLLEDEESDELRDDETPPPHEQSTSAPKDNVAKRFFLMRRLRN